MKSDNKGAVVSKNSATGTAEFVTLPPGQAAKAEDATSQNKKVLEFVNQYPEAFGLNSDSVVLRLLGAEKDSIGQTHLKYKQQYAGVPVFGASLNAHFNKKNELTVISGTLIPDIEVAAVPSRSAGEAGDLAVRLIESSSDRSGLFVRNNRLVIYREGLAKGTPGINHLAYQVEVGNGGDVREFVFIDAHSGKFIDQITGVNDAMFRRAYDGNGGSLAYVLSIWPGSPFWVEGDSFPTVETEANNMLLASQETYDLFSNAYGRDSFDGAGANMDSIFDRGYSCPNASWNGSFISFCPGLTTDDVTGHEWGHAYTEYTDNLIYAWQPGALNESYSDVVGETVDMINGRGTDLPDNARTAGSCTVFAGSPPPTLTINDGPAAGSYFAKASVNEPALPFTVGPLPMVHASPADGCAAMADATGQIVIIDWEINGAPSVCGSGTRAANAIAANAEGIIFVGPESGLLNLGSNAGIGSVQVTYTDGETIKAGLPADATFSIQLGSDNSVDWLVGEDSTAPGLTGALRDMWTPGCMGDPGKVSDPVYHCSTADQGGVHINSGIPNHAFALLVDGGSFNSQNVDSIGLTKANHIYYRAKTYYQGPATDFAAHADALEQSCEDLIGAEVASLIDGSPSGEIVSEADCDAVAAAMLAVEMRLEPVQCGFEPLLAQNPPPLCESPTKKSRILFTDGFENGNSSLDRWSRSNEAVTPADFTERDWVIASNLPDGRPGQAFFGIDPPYGTCSAGGDESAVLHLDSPQITVPAMASNLQLVFDHWIATEDGYDGGNVKISVNGGEWETIDPSAFIYNPYNINGWGVDFIPGLPYTTNPIGWDAGHFSGTDQGSVGGTWGRSIIDLAPYAQPKDKIRLRFDMGTDGCGGVFGWYVDDVSVYECR